MWFFVMILEKEVHEELLITLTKVLLVLKNGDVLSTLFFPHNMLSSLEKQGKVLSEQDLLRKKDEGKAKMLRLIILLTFTCIFLQQKQRFMSRCVS